MNNSLLYQTPAEIIVLLLFIAMLIFYWIGYKIHQYQIKKNTESAKTESLGTIEGSLLGLLALLLSFTFNMADSRYNARRQVIIEEANDIGTAILRCDLYSDSIRNNLRADFKQYVGTRIAYYNAGTDDKKIDIELKKASEISQEIWKTVMLESKQKESLIRSQQMIPALNNMIDIVTTRDAIKNATIPNTILYLLFLLILISSLLIGYSINIKRIKYISLLGFTCMTILTVYIILDLDRPRRGIINVDASEGKMIELSRMF